MRSCLQKLARRWLYVIYRVLFFYWVRYVYEQIGEQIEFEGMWNKRCVYGRVTLKNDLLTELILKIKNICSEEWVSSKGTEIFHVWDYPVLEDVPEILDMALDVMVRVLLEGEKITFEHRTSERVLT